MGPIIPGVSTIHDAITVPGASNEKARFYGKVENASDCQTACEKTLHVLHLLGTIQKAVTSYMCYCCIDGLWVRTLEATSY